VCCVGGGLCDGLITGSEETYRVCVLCVWAGNIDSETAWDRHWSAAAQEKKIQSQDTCVRLPVAVRVLCTAWSRVLLQKLTDSQLVKFPTFYGTRRFITVLTSARHLSLS